MGSNPLLKTHKCSSLSSETQRSSSKSHNSLLKILRIISSAVPPQIIPPSVSSDYESDLKSGFGIDLNVGFTEESAWPIDGDKSSSTTINTGDEKSPFAADHSGVLTVYDSECDRGEAEEIVELESNGVCETKKDEIGEMKEQQGGFMGLLIEAATLIFGEFKDEFECKEPEEKKSLEDRTKEEDNENNQVVAQVKRRKEDDSYPVVRSKRGRIQVLPNKYKDSILQPLTALPRIRSTICARRSSK